VKDLIVINPEEKISLDALDLIMIPQVTTTTPLFDLLNHFQKGKSHMAVVIDSTDFTTIVGIVTLEDIIEELLNVEILDERDYREENQHREAIRISIENGETAIVYRPSLTLTRPSLSLQRDVNATKVSSFKGVRDTTTTVKVPRGVHASVKIDDEPELESYVSSSETSPCTKSEKE